MFNTVSIALSGLTASSLKASTAASNIANISTSGALSSEDGQAPYEARFTSQTSLESGGVSADVAIRNPAFVPAFDPGSPFANSDGLIGAPNVDLAEEIVNLKLAETTYKANVKTLQVASELSDELLNIFDDRV